MKKSKNVRLKERTENGSLFFNVRTVFGSKMGRIWKKNAYIKIEKNRLTKKQRETERKTEEIFNYKKPSRKSN